MAQAYRSAVVAGLSPVDFWSLTPYQTRIAMEATMEREDKQAWLIAAFTRIKKLPKYESLSREKKSIKSGLDLKKILEKTALKEKR
jgi:hypothetical protein